MINLKEIVEKKYQAYLEKTQDWSDDMPTGRKGECDLCNNVDDLTSHHLVPKRVFQGKNIKLSSFLDKLTIDICTDCHGKMHPENIWKKDLLKFQEIFEKEVDAKEKEMEKILKASDNEVSKAKQEVNNINTKYNTTRKIVDDKNAAIRSLKEEVAGLKKKLQETKAELSTINDEHRAFKKEERIEKDHAVVFFNVLKLYSDPDEYKKWIKDNLKEPLIRERDTWEKRENLTVRDLRLLFKKINLTQMFLQEYEEENYNDMVDYLNKTFHEQYTEAIKEVFDVEVRLEELKEEKNKKDGKKL